ncbi:hypothetical protein NLG97_g2753 [Lecanicillium saksenae]|uniref:Uncharacterized protein n=1 Tax=Lecanicillium saksenae TaxID=468837 RepID=A0ACC1R0N4_9HYPO|nr:hypothetical protein NLG97_g2753 [Lecanicillium saksenae]
MLQSADPPSRAPKRNATAYASSPEENVSHGLRPVHAGPVLLLGSRLLEAESESQTSDQPTTFTIDTFVPARSHRDDEYDALREIHKQAFAVALDDEDNTEEPSNIHQSVATASVASSTSRAAADIWRKPQFNTASAQELLETFTTILGNLPFIRIPRGCTIPQLAATQPFVLLAVLTVTSGSGSVQKHSLYDDEFLKILGLKYVSGGDGSGSLELLQGLLVYCAWYPFHLKPKTSQLARCMRMASDIVRDMNLDENFLSSQPWEQGMRTDDLDKIRTYLAYVYLVSTYIVVWKGDRCVSTQQPQWSTTAINLLEQYAENEDDITLATLARISGLSSDASGAINGMDSMQVRNSQLVLVGLAQQFQQARDSLSVRFPGVLNKPVIRMQMIYLDAYLDVGSLLAFPVAKTALSPKKARFAPPMARMRSSLKKLGAFLDVVGSLDDDSMLAFTVNDWTRLIIILTLAFRLSFPVSLAPDFDWLSARNDIQLEEFLSRVSRGFEASADSNGILAANRVVLGVLKSKYNQRQNTLGQAAPMTQSSRSAACPVMGGSGGAVIEQWDLGHGHPPALSADPDMPDVLPMLHSIWSTEGVGWQDLDKIPWDSFDRVTGGPAQ